MGDFALMDTAVVGCAIVLIVVAMVCAVVVFTTPQKPESASAPAKDEHWVVRCVDHRAWWGPNNSGYAESLLYAGLYTREDAERIARQSHPRAGSNLKDGETSDIAMSLRDAIAFINHNEALPKDRVVSVLVAAIA